MINFLSKLGIVIGIVAGCYLYYDYSQDTIETLRQSNAQLQQSVRVCEDTTQRLRTNIQQSQQLSTQLEQRAVAAEKYHDELIGKLRKHDLTALTLKKPQLIENRVNNATKEIFNEIESSTRD